MLTVAMLAVLALFGTVSALDPSLTFQFMKYPRVFRRNEVACQVCYGEFDCLSLDKGRCGYNVAASQVLKEDEETTTVNNALMTKVDSMMYDLVLENTIKEYKECVPLISSYTNCNKENICTGCRTCECDDRGRWSCAEQRKCSRRRSRIDHRVLVAVLDRLKLDNNASRYKRSFDTSEESTPHSIYEDLADWIYVSKPITIKVTNDNGPTPAIVPTTTPAVKTMEESNNNITFDEILNYDDLAHFIKSSEKNVIIDNKRDKIDSQHFLEILRNIEEGKDDIEPIDNPHINIDLLKDLKKYLKEDSVNRNESSNSSNDQTNIINTIMGDTDDFDLEKQPSSMNSKAYALKRNVRHVNATTRNETAKINETRIRNKRMRSETKSFKHEIKNITHSEELRHLAEVVTVLISNQRKEIVHLNYIKDNILRFIKKTQMLSYNFSVMHKQDNALDNDARKSGWKVDILKFYLGNLNRDIKDMLRDINAIQKLKRLGVIPAAKSISNLRPLLAVLTDYYTKADNRWGKVIDKNYTLLPNSLSSITYKKVSVNNKSTTSDNNTSSVKKTNTEPKPRRRAFDSSFINDFKIQLIKRALTRILTIIDNDRLSTTGLNELTPKIKHMFYNIVNKHYVDDSPVAAIRDPHFNLTKILTNIAQLWQNAEVDILKFQPADRLYNLKLLYFTLSHGVDQVKDALSSIKFGFSRRMNFIEEQVGKGVVADVTKFLTTIDDRVKYYIIDAKKRKNVDPKIIKETKSVWHHIKNAFSNSKNGFTNFFRSKLKPKSYIVNEKARKRVEELNKQKFLEVMKRWQVNFDSNSARNKRSPRHYNKRMKNIIPKYLRGKVNPALDTKEKDEKRIYGAKMENKGLRKSIIRPVTTTEKSKVTPKTFKTTRKMHTLTKKSKYITTRSYKTTNKKH